MVAPPTKSTNNGTTVHVYLSNWISGNTANTEQHSTPYNNEEPEDTPTQKKHKNQLSKAEKWLLKTKSMRR